MVPESSQADERAKIKVLLADDHPAFREGLSRLLGEEAAVQVVGVAADGAEAVSMAHRLIPDVVVMDVSMPVINGVEATRQIKAGCPNTAVLILSAYEYESYIISAIEAGAAAYLMKTVSMAELVGAIRAVYAGETVLNGQAARKVFSRLSSAGPAVSGKSSQRLQQRELEILRQAARGLSNKGIASGLEVSERTVQTHLMNIFRKLGVGSRTEAVLRALREGWITPDDLP